MSLELSGRNNLFCLDFVLKCGHCCFLLQQNALHQFSQFVLSVYKFDCKLTLSFFYERNLLTEVKKTKKKKKIINNAYLFFFRKEITKKGTTH